MEALKKIPSKVSYSVQPFAIDRHSCNLCSIRVCFAFNDKFQQTRNSWRYSSCFVKTSWKSLGNCFLLKIHHVDLKVRDERRIAHSRYWVGNMQSASFNFHFFQQTLLIRVMACDGGDMEMIGNIESAL